MSTMIPTVVDFVFGATGTTVVQHIFERGKFNYMVLKTPDFTNAVTTKIQVKNAAGDIIWDLTEAFSNGKTIAEQAKNTTVRYNFDWDIPVHRGWTIVAVLSGDAGGSGGTIEATIPIEADK